MILYYFSIYYIYIYMFLYVLKKNLHIILNLLFLKYYTIYYIMSCILHKVILHIKSGIKKQNCIISLK